MVENMQQPLGSAFEEVQSRLGPQLEEARRNLGEMNEKAVTFIRRNPGTCLLGALAVGFLIGRIASR